MKERAKKFARKHNTNVSQLVENFLRSVTDNQIGFVPEPGSWTESLFGVAQLPKEYEGLSYKQIKEKEIPKKHD